MQATNAAHATTATADIYEIDRRPFHQIHQQRLRAAERAKMLELKKAQLEEQRTANALKKEQLALLRKQNELLEQLVAALQAK